MLLNKNKYENGNGKEYKYAAIPSGLHKLYTTSIYGWAPFPEIRPLEKVPQIEKYKNEIETAEIEIKKLKEIEESISKKEKAFKIDIDVSDLIMSCVGSIVGIGLLFTGIFTDYIYAIGGSTILALSLFHLSWVKKNS